MFHTCGALHSPVEAAVEAPRGGAKKRPPTIDIHCHLLTLAAEPLVAKYPQKQQEPAMLLQAMGAASVAHNNAVMLPNAFPKLTNVKQRLADMDAMGVDIQVISPSPTQYYYWTDRELAEQVVRVQNEHVAEICAQHPKRFLGLGTLALQHAELAVSQLEHAMRDLGLKGVEISTTVNGEELDADLLMPFWKRAEELGAIVFIHPFGTTLGSRVTPHYLSNIIGQPLETTIALSHLIFSGVLDRHPRLKIIAAHGGGYLPSYCGRSNHGHAARPEARDLAPKLPIEYLKKIWFDTLVYEPEALRHLINVVGASQVIVGTDYPFDMGHYDPHSLLAQTPDITESEAMAILGGNAASLLGVDLGVLLA